jgi:ATP:corrinoid adenosyltransferase
MAQVTRFIPFPSFAEMNNGKHLFEADIKAARGFDF